MSYNINDLFVARNSRSGYEIEQSLRFESNAYLSRSPGSSGNRNVWTLSLWAKRGNLGSTAGSQQDMYSAGTGGTDILYWTSSDQIAVDAPALSVLVSNDRFRDPSAWYHIVMAVDATNGTNSNRTRIYVNNREITSWATDARGSLTSNKYLTNSTERHTLGIRSSDLSSTPYKGYESEFYLVDGQQLTPSDFGEYDDNGVWRPKPYTGTYGTNGFYLTFDPTATNGIGHDHSGNGNNWTANSFTTSGTGTDVMSDTPTTNWCTLNPLHTESSFTYSNGNLKVQQSTGAGSGATSGGTVAVSSGKWFCEMSAIDKNATNALIGVCTVDGFDGNRQLNESLTGGSGYGYVTNGNTATGSAYGSTWDLYDNMGIALDLDSAQNTVTFYKNGASQGARNINNAAYVFACSNGQGSSYVTYRTNFGQRDFLMTPGTTSGTDYFNTVTYSGNGSTQSITGVGFQPDLVWIKSTSNSYDHYIADSIRGAYAFLISNNTGSQNSTTNYDPMSSFDSDGFTVRYTTTGGSTNNQTNTSGASYIAWCWKAGGASSSNTDGSITSTVSASTAGAFSVCTYTGNSTSGATFGHGLDDAPGFVIVKNRDSGAQPWRIFHSSLGNTKAFKFDSNSADTDSAFWNNTSPSSTVVTLGNDNSTNANGDAYVAYCWAEKAGVTKIGTYTGNETLGGGPEVDCGFRPACVVMKADAGAAWEIHDFKRDANSYLAWSSSSTPTARQANKVLLTDNGFIIMGNDGNINLNGATIYFIAFAAEHTTDDTYKALNSANLPAPSIKDGSEYFGTVLYNGDGGTSNSVTGLSFQADVVWGKSRSNALPHNIFDVVRGFDKQLDVNDTATEVDRAGDAVTVNSTGFTLDATYCNINNSSTTNVAWAWKAGGSGSSIATGSIDGTNPTIASTVSANPTAGFSIVSYTGTLANATVGHGLGVAPSMIICKQRTGAANDWGVYHKSLGNDKFLKLNTTDSQITASTVWNNTSPTSTVFSLGTSNIGNNSAPNIAYCFAEIEGYSKFGSYTANNSSDGPFIYCGFKPALVLLRSYNGSTGRDWLLYDSTRSTYNNEAGALTPNEAITEAARGDATYKAIDFVSNGFKLRTNGTPNMNASSESYIFMAWAEHPFGGSNVSPAAAR